VKVFIVPVLPGILLPTLPCNPMVAN
jgi:hypothetical protein